VQAPSQQTPSTQKPEAQALAPLQDSPGARFAVQVPALQKLPALQSASEPHGLAHVEPVPLHWKRPHSLDGSVEAATGLQVPTLPVLLQASQVPLHAVVQQVLSAQKPVAHWLAAVQAWPAPLLHTQVPPWHVEPDLQSALPVQAARQLPTAPLQNVLPHSLAGSCPAATAVQLPAVPGRLQDSQASPHALPQHTPSAQKPDAQPEAAVHAWPRAALGVQVPAPQKLPGLQSASEAHGEMHAAVLPRQRPRPQSLAGSVRAGSEAHVPTAPTRLQDWHAPPQPALQHTPSAQKPEAHCAASTHACPLARTARHCPPLQ